MEQGKLFVVKSPRIELGAFVVGKGCTRHKGGPETEATEGIQIIYEGEHSGGGSIFGAIGIINSLRNQGNDVYFFVNENDDVGLYGLETKKCPDEE